MQLIEVLTTGAVQVAELDATVRQSLLRVSDPAWRRRAERLFQRHEGSDREALIRRYQPVLEMTGDRRRGAILFARTCLVCHGLQGTGQGQGQGLGPDLSGLGSRPKEAILIDLLDPSREVPPEFLSYSLVTAAGETLTGIIVRETAASVTLRRPGAPDEIVLRTQIKERRAEGKSLMPDGLEQGMELGDVADLLEFLRQPEAALLPASQ
jgi:putative heme-binding domain-containing protein